MHEERILLYHILHNANLRGLRFLSLSKALYRHRAEYFDKLGVTQRNGNYYVWIRFAIWIIREAARQGIDFVRYYIKQTLHEEEYISAQHQHRADSTLTVYRFFKKKIASSIGCASEQLQLSFPTVSRSAQILQSLGLLSQVSEGARNRIFAHKGLWKYLTSE